jgi:hypothetical protein
VNDIIPVKVAAIKVVQFELNASLQKAARHFEAFISDRSAHDQLTESLSALTDIAGILKMLVMPGASQLAQEMIHLLKQVMSEPEKANDFSLSALSHGFVGMPCYLEYIVDRQQAIPALVLPFINEIRAALRQVIIFESQQADFTANDVLLVDNQAHSDDDLAALTKRLRQMYQIGLIGLLREENLELKIQLMHRALSRMAKSLGSSENRTQFRVAEAVLEGFLSGSLELNFTRKRTLSLFDAEFKALASQESAPQALQTNKALLNELVYLTQLSYTQHPASKEVIAVFQLEKPELTDSLLQRERAIMQGPNAETILTMVAALREELAQSKEVLEIAAQDSSGSGDFGNLVALFQRTSDILSVVGLKTPSQILADLKNRVKAWTEGQQYDRDGLLVVADGLIYIESVLSNLSRLDLNFKDSDADDSSKLALMMKSQFNEAQAIVLRESQAGIALAKKDINSFIESDFDMAYINNVAEGLISVQGGLRMLHFNDASAVLDSGIRFIQATVKNGVDQQQAQNMLETMADALIALEYYLSEMELHAAPPPNVLQVAEQSLASLGYPVTK